jgi:hypothetical protein
MSVQESKTGSTGSGAETTSGQQDSGLLGGGQGGAAEKSWHEQLPEDMRGEASLKMIKDIPNLAKSYLNAQKMVGAEKIAIPGKHASEQDWKQVFAKLGVPETVDKYEFKAPEGFNPEIMGKFKEIAHGAGILPQQAEKLVNFYQDLNKNASESNLTQQKAKMEEGVTALRKEWGNAFDQEVEVAKAGLQSFGDDNFKKFLDESGLKSHPEMVKLFNRLGKATGEQGIKGQGTSGFSLAPQAAQAQINSIKSDPSHPYWNDGHQGHKSAVSEMQKLFQQANPEK